MADERIREDVREDLKDIESVLTTLSPRPSRIDRDRLMFLAGQASLRAAQADAKASAWMLATTISTVAAIVLAALLAVQPGPRVVREIEYVDRPQPQQEHSAVPIPASPELARKPAHVEQAPAAAPSSSDNFRTASRLFRNRFPALALSVDAFPAPQSHGSGEPGPPATYRVMMADLFPADEPRITDESAPPRFFDWTFFLGRGENL